MILNSLFLPNSIAVIGVSRKPGKVGHEIVNNILNGGFKGQIVPVNPFAKEILGLNCYKSIGDYHGKIDLSIIAVQAPLVLDAVMSSIKAGAKTIVITSSGFAEIGSKGAKLQQEISKLCADSNVNLVGPNCFGIINTINYLNASFSKNIPKTGGVSVLSQSGSICTALLEWSLTHRIGIAKVVSLGNKAGLNELDFLEAFAKDDETEVVVGYLENISSGREFLKVANSITFSKPFILLRGGITRAGIWAASAHTGTLAGADTAYAAAFKQAGIIRADNIDSLFDYTAAFSTQLLPKGDRVVVITNAGGPAVMAADAIEQYGLKLAKIRGHHIELFKEQFSNSINPFNPIDVLGDADPMRYSTVLEAAQDDDDIDAVIVILAPHSMTQSTDTIRSISLKAKGNKPIFMVLMGMNHAEVNFSEVLSQNLPIYTSPGRAVSALSAMLKYQKWKNQPERIISRFPVNRRRVERIISRHIKTNLNKIGEVETKEILRAYDFAVPDGRLAVSADDAVEIAQRIGFPVAMKVVSSDIISKSDIGGIKLNISSVEDVRDTYDLISLRVARRASNARIKGIYIEKMATEGLHTIIGMVSDPRFGPIMIFGLGGAFIDRLDSDSSFLAPITADEAMRMLSESRSFMLLKDNKYGIDVDLSAIVTGLQRTSQLATDFPQIKELNINPLIIGKTGAGAVAVDARMSILRTRTYRN